MATRFITPTVIAGRALATLYNTIVLAGLVSRDYDGEFTGKVGDTITIRKPAVFNSELFDRSRGITLQEPREDSTTITLDKLRNVSFLVTDEDMTLRIERFGEQLLDPAAMQIAQDVDADIAEGLVDTANGRDGGGVATWDGRIANSGFREARTKLTRNKLPLTERHAVLSPEAIAVCLSDELLISAEKAGTTDALREADIGRILGFDTYETQQFGSGADDKGVADGVYFHRSAYVLAVRPLQVPRGVSSSQTATIAAEGLSLRVVYAYNLKYKQDEVSVDMLYGVKATRPEGVVQADFGQGS